MAQIRYEQATRLYPGTKTPAVSALDLTVEDGEFVVLVGPSGSGKSTALRMLAGLEEVDAGAIYLDERDVSHLSPKRRDIAMVFQSYALYPHLNVRDNISFHLKVKKLPRVEIDERVRQAAELLDLEPYLDRKPAKLSGGQRQRVAMGRAIVRQPQAFLMDEPLSNLDAKLRVATRARIASLQRRLGVTTLYVTHDQVEAMTMGDRVAVLREGTLQQYDTPWQLFTRPANLFVAGFIGSPPMNLLDGQVDGEVARVGPLTVPLSAEARAALSSAAVTVGIRPEALTISAPGLGVGAVVEVVENLGSDAYATCSTTLGGREAQLIVRCDPALTPPRGETVGLVLQGSAVHLFDSISGNRLPDPVTQVVVREPHHAL